MLRTRYQVTWCLVYTIGGYPREQSKIFYMCAAAAVDVGYLRQKKRTYQVPREGISLSRHARTCTRSSWESGVYPDVDAQSTSFYHNVRKYKDPFIIKIKIKWSLHFHTEWCENIEIKVCAASQLSTFWKNRTAAAATAVAAAQEHEPHIQGKRTSSSGTAMPEGSSGADYHPPRIQEW